MDAGALFFEFSRKVLHTVSEEYFEGSEGRKVPKSHWGGTAELEMAGAMVVHSMLQGGPHPPCNIPINGTRRVYDADITSTQGLPYS